jgi:hypothetical protein
MWNAVYPYLVALVPTIGLLVICYVVFKAIFEADRRERRAQAEWEREQRAHRSANTPDEPSA